MGYVTREQIEQAKAMDLLTYLKNYDPDELVRVSPGTYCTSSHDSLKISNGKWHWFSRNIGGRSALDYLIKVQGYPFVKAVETILGRLPAAPPAKDMPQPQKRRQLLLPERNVDDNAVKAYLGRRGINGGIIDHCIARGLLYESKGYHNAVFVGYDTSGEARYAALRGTYGDYKGEAAGSDKRFSFSLAEGDAGSTVHVFESAIDLLSYASLMLIKGRDWREASYLSLAGVFRTKRKDVLPLSLSGFLAGHPETQRLCLHLDNDETGRGAAAGIVGALAGKYEVQDLPPTCGKDVNDYLQMYLATVKRNGRQTR